MIHIVLVNYNGTDDTVACAQSLQHMKSVPFTLTIVDNASKPEQSAALRLWGRSLAFVDMPPEPAIRTTPEMIVGAMPGLNGPTRVNVVFSEKNLGFAGGNNIGIDLALRDPEMTFVWILNNDTEVDAHALTALVRRMEEDTAIGICGSTLVYFDSRNIVQALGGRFNSWLARPEQLAASAPLTALPPRETIERNLAYVAGASMLVSRAYLEAVGPMDEGYFLYFEEIDWAMRGNGRFKLGWAPDSIVYHKEGGAIGTSSRTRPSDLSLRYMSASSLRFLRLHRPMLLPIGLARLGLKAILYLLRGDGRAALVICRSIVQS